MLRKTYRLLQKTGKSLQGTSDELLHMATRPLHHLSGRDSAPMPSFHACPPDIWPGDFQNGQELISFVSELNDSQIALVTGPAGSHQIDPSFRRFSWLHDLRTVGTSLARETALRLLASWQDHGTAQVAPVQTRTLRLFNILGTYAFFAPSLTPSAGNRLLSTLIHEVGVLKNAMKNQISVIDGFFASIGILAAHFALNDDLANRQKYLQQTERAMAALILSDGGPKTRCASTLPDILITLLNLRNLMNGAGVPVPVFLTHAIDRTIPAIRFFRMNDGGFCLFHGSRQENPVRLEQILALSHMNGRAPLSLPYTGYERLSMGMTTVILDSGISESLHHASTTAFEMVTGDHRLIVNCGQHGRDRLWQDLLAATAAHSTVVLDQTDNRPLRGLARVTTARRDTEEGQMVEVTHDGYLTRNGFSHTRRLFLDANGHALKGQDDLSVSIPPVLPLPYTVRFHLHPRVSAVPLQGGSGVLLKLPDGALWRFAHDGDGLKIEDSVYLGETGLPQKTGQIVLNGHIFGARKTIRWALQKA